MEYVLAQRRQLIVGSGETAAAGKVAMAEVNRYRAEDRRAVDALYRRVFGNDAADASRLRWEWQYRRNPEQPRRRAGNLDRPRRPGHRRAIRDDAGAAGGRGTGDRGILGHGRHGRA